MKMNKIFKSCINAGNWIGVGTAIGAAVFALTNEPVWIAVGVAMGAALGWRKPKNQNEEIVRHAMQVIWNECNVSRVGEFYSEDFKADYPHTNWGLGLQGICLLAAQVHKDLPNYEENIEELIDAGDKIIVTLAISGNHPSNGEKISFRDVTILTLKNGKIISQSGVGDLLTLYVKLGMIEFP